MTLTEQWKKGELEVLDKLIEIIEFTEQNRALSDEYLKNNGQYAREDYDSIVGEYEYGIVFVMVDYILPYLKQVQQLRKFLEEFNALEVAKENQQLKELLKDCRFMLREMSDVNNWLEGDECELNYYMATECGKYVTKITNAIGEK